MPLTLELRVSRGGCGLLVALHLVAFILVLVLPPLAPTWLQVMLAVVVCCSAVFYVRRDGLLRAADSITRVVWDADGVWHVHLRNGAVHTAQLQHDTIVWPEVVFLALRLDTGRRRVLILLRDSAAAESLRQLRVRWRTG